MIYAWNEADPDGDDPNAVMYHGNANRGTQSLNLLGGQQVVPPDPADLESFDVIVNNVCSHIQQNGYLIKLIIPWDHICAIQITGEFVLSNVD